MSQVEPRVIPTKYAGCLFRSRTEARWAVCFDRLGIDWVWEPQRYALPSGHSYLPDFWLPQFDLHAEVKGTEKMWLIDEHRYNEAVLTGALPGRGLMVLSEIPSVRGHNMPYHRVVARDPARGSGLCVHFELIDWLLSGETSMACTDVDVVGRETSREHKEIVTQGYLPGYGRPTEVVVEAYDLARSARFEPPLARVVATIKPTPMVRKVVPPPRSLYTELKAAEARAVALEKEIDDHHYQMAQEDQDAGYCWPCGSMHSRCPAGLEDGSSEHEPDYDRLLELGEFPGHAFDEDTGDMVGDPSDYLDDILGSHQCSMDECNVCTTCGCPGWECNWASHLEDD